MVNTVHNDLGHDDMLQSYCLWDATFTVL